MTKLFVPYDPETHRNMLVYLLKPVEGRGGSIDVEVTIPQTVPQDRGELEKSSYVVVVDAPEKA